MYESLCEQRWSLGRSKYTLSSNHTPASHLRAAFQHGRWPLRQTLEEKLELKTNRKMCVFSHTQAVECLQNTTVWHVNWTAIQIAVFLKTAHYKPLCTLAQALFSLGFWVADKSNNFLSKMPLASEINRACYWGYVPRFYHSAPSLSSHDDHMLLSTGPASVNPSFSY